MPLRDDRFLKLDTLLNAMLGSAAEHREKGELAAALEATSKRAADLLGMPRHVLDSVAPAGCAMMLRDPKKSDAYAQLLEADADTTEAMGKSDEALALRERARAVRAPG